MANPARKEVLIDKVRIMTNYLICEDISYAAIRQE